MNTSQLRKLGVPDACVTSAIMGIQAAARAGQFRGAEAKRLIRSILENPENHTASVGAQAERDICSTEDHYAGWSI